MYQRTTPESTLVTIAGPSPATYVTRRIAGRKRINPRSDDSQTPNPKRMDALITNASKAIRYRDQVFAARQ